MGAQFKLVNLDKKETIDFAGIDTGTKLHELAGTIVAGNIVTWYLLQNIGDRISFINDTEATQTLFGTAYNWSAFAHYPDVTLQVANHLIGAGILQNYGAKVIDEEENISCYSFQNIWDPAAKNHI